VKNHDVDLTELYCSQCRRLEVFEQPECVDHSTGQCPEWVCVMCGTAVFAGLDVAPPPSVPVRRTA
jgi:hypothetical protein